MNEDSLSDGSRQSSGDARSGRRRLTFTIFIEGQRAVVTDSTASSFSVEGRVREVSPMIDQDMRLGTVRIDLPVSTGKDKRVFKPGNFAHATIEVGSKSPLAVPAAAVLSRENKSFVFVVNSDNTVSTRDVKTGGRVEELRRGSIRSQPGRDCCGAWRRVLKNGDLVRVGQ